MKLSTILLGCLSYASVALAETHYFNWTTEWRTLNLDGGKERQVITCNGEFPWPVVRIKRGDTVVVTLNNGLPDETTSLHFHGMFQHNNTQIDGPPMLTQCDIVPGSSYTYNFTVEDRLVLTGITLTQVLNTWMVSEESLLLKTQMDMLMITMKR
ncbi:unnamed protein product [Ambrosiozyma monospora]|uniref:Unnamed protein product n=1 Tax=Ambrosiozyma monospora TaxID=43982 RepID=A0ACB5TRE4_AMBMO|nr:unnamed protein product [Ambrosiozyma monospora]